MASYIDAKHQGAKACLCDILVLGGLVVAAAAFRLYNLSALGLTHDESIQGVTVKGILRHGYPLLDTGYVYVRALPYLYFEALCAQLLGWGEAALRLPSALFNLATIPVIYFFTRDLLCKKTALVAAMILAFSTWEIEFSRVARMYTAFQFFYMLSLYAFYKGFVKNHPVYYYATFPLFLITFTIFQLSISLPLSFVFLALIRDYPGLSKFRPLFWAIAFSVIYFAYWHYIQMIFPFDPAIDRLSDGISYPPKLSLSIYDHIKTQTIIPSFTLYENLSQSYSSVSWLIIAFPLFVAGLAYKFGINRADKYLCFISVLISISSIFHQIGFSLLLLFLFILMEKNTQRLSHSSIFIPLGIIVVSFIGWLAYAIYNPEWHLAESSSRSILRRLFSLLFNYPLLYDKHINFLLEGWLFFSIVSFSGMILLTIHYLSEREPQILYLIGVSYLFPLILLSFFGANWNKPRYFFHLYSIMIIFFSYMAVIVAERFIRKIHMFVRINDNGLIYQWLTIAIAILLSVIVSEDLDILESLKLTQRTYTTYNTVSLRSLNQYRPYEVDHRTCSQYFKVNHEPEDVVISFGSPITRYVYTEQLDYFVRKMKIVSADMFSGSIPIPSLEALLDVVEQGKWKKVWILGDDCAFVPNWYTAEMCDYLRSLEPYVVCRGEDGRVAAYLLDRSD